MSIPDPNDSARAEPQSFRARALMASLTVKDLERSVQWYEQVVGFVVEQRHEHQGRVVAVALLAGDVAVLLNQDDGAKGWDRAKGEGISLQFTTTQDLDAHAARIKSRGGALAAEPADMPWGARVFRVVDPDGFKLSFST